MANFEDKLEKLEKLSENIKQSDISLEDALKNFEEGIKLAKTLEKELDKMEGKIQILMNGEETKDGKVELGLFDETTEITGTRSENGRTKKSPFTRC